MSRSFDLHTARPAAPSGHRRPLALRALGLATLLGSAACGAALAASPPPRANLQVQLVRPAVADINLPATYTVTVTNLAGDRSAAITATVSFPLTSTSPQVYLLGTATPLDQRCSMTGRILTCNLAGLRRGWSTSFVFNYAAPVSTKPLLITAAASSATFDPVPGNNSASVLPNLRYPVRAIIDGSVTVRGCTGTALSAFEECERFPGSIWSHGAQFQSNGAIIYAAPGYSGSWSQNAAKTSLRMEMFTDQGQGPVKTAEFNGWAINGKNCFQGLTTFTPGSAYVSPYEVCL